MTDDTFNGLSRREFVQGTASGVLLAVGPAAVLAATSTNKDKDKQAVLAQIPPLHAANVKRLQDWIALPSIAAENRNYPQGPQYMADLARGAGFYLVDSTNPKLRGLDGAVASFVECLYALA